MYLCWRERTLIAGLLLAERPRSIAGSEGIARCSLLAGVAILPDQRRGSKKRDRRVRGPGQLVFFQAPLIGRSHSPKYLEWRLASLAGHQLNAGSSWASCTGEARRRRNVSTADRRSVAVAPDSGKDRRPTTLSRVVRNLAVIILATILRRTGGKVTGRCQELQWNVQRGGMSTEQGAVETGTTRFFNSASQVKGSPFFMVAWGELYMPWLSWRPSWPSQRSRLINVDDVLNPSMTDPAMRSVMGSDLPWMGCLMSGGGFSSTARGVDNDLPIDRVQDPDPSITMVVRGTDGQCRVGGNEAGCRTAS
ncbi:hypothetical protein ASPFODRAFT_77126 [Aspergillus luchuensis CBS 106.47]|uniref:Uncharacterized protein n=1 Tax=Aspergillus luchuensis (strain CBS 106.47) TaxID=1137211 RepID=A0A1M3U123_ASPLC|nr:hypothetical protein ASPFODRAFT_77126 [Aspergillus luchuensis CBS 106.47]